jgi:hypothetical protein
MTYLEMKKKVLSLIEEVTDIAKATTGDNDIDTKLPYVTNQIMYELSRIKKIPRYYAKQVEANSVATFEDLEGETSDKIYQIDIISGVDSELRGKRITFLEDGQADIYYFKYPERITEKTPDTYEFELDDDVLEIMPYGIAADLLKSDVSSNYGQVYANRYEMLKQGLDPRDTVHGAIVVGGYDV